MALTKLPKDGLATDSVSTSQIEDGTIQNTEFADSTLTSAKLANSTIANAKLSNSSFTINGTSVNLGASITAEAVVDWQSVITSNTTMVKNRGYFVNTTSGAITMTLPSSASIGDTISIKDYAGTFATNNLTIGRNSHKIQGETTNSTLSTNRAQVTLVYVDATKGWLFTEEHNVGDLEGPSYTSATGGTVTNSGDYRIHTFNSSSNFVVSSVGNPGGSGDVVDYVVVAGGGSGGGCYGTGNTGGGGGAGGYRESHSNPVSGPYTASPLATPTGITLSTQTYPITVGAGGAAGTGPGFQGQQGANSIFSTITSSGGGGGGGGYLNCGTVGPGKPGGSGGAAGASNQGTWPGGSGNTPPVSPPQGNNGGTQSGSSDQRSSGGGGGAGGAGSNAPNGTTGGAGGNGIGTAINPAVGTPGPSGSLKYFSGGGGGSTRNQPGGNTAGAGGYGGGANGVLSPLSGGAATGLNATANTGGGGGANGHGPQPPRPNCIGGLGASGVVIIRYKYQN